MKRRTVLRTGLVLLTAGLVIAGAWVMISPYDAAGDLAAQVAVAKGQMPAPGAETLLRRSIATPPRLRPRPGTDATRLGPLQSVAYLGALPNPLSLLGLGRRIDSFLATYRNGTLVWRISPAKDGAPQIAVYFNPAPMTPQQIIQLFSTFSAGAAALNMASQLVFLLVFALIGRLVLRIRL